MRKVDKLGRIVIPQDLRRKYGLTEGVTIEFFDVGEGITVKASQPFCKICHNRISNDAEFPLCKSCISEITRKYNK